MKILTHTPETITVEKNGVVRVYNLDELRRKAIHDDELMEVLGAFIRFRLKQRAE